VVEVAGEADERVRDQPDRDRSEQECERYGSADEPGRRDAVEGHRGRRRHDPDRDRDRLPEAQLASEMPTRRVVDRSSFRRHHSASFVEDRVGYEADVQQGRTRPARLRARASCVGILRPAGTPPQSASKRVA
jgi:hypothetical protein